MARWAIAISCGLLFGPTSAASGQVVQQTIQLPTFRSFSVSTSVLVPDRGTAVLGGVDRAAYTSSTFGVPGGGPLLSSRSRHSDISSSRLSASATIIDHAELDRAVLSAAAARRESPRAAEVRRKAAFLNQHVDRRGGLPAQSTAASQRQSAARFK